MANSKLQIWDKVSPIFTPSGEMFTAEQWIEMYKWVNIPGAIPVVSVGPINGGEMSELSVLKASAISMGATFSDDLTPEELLDAIVTFHDEANAAVANTVSDQTRIADALEDMNELQLAQSMGE
jgi:hypothetical protein